MAPSTPRSNRSGVSTRTISQVLAPTLLVPRRARSSVSVVWSTTQPWMLAPGAVRFTRPGMAVTLNGIAQGFIADRIAVLMQDHGAGSVLLDVGEVVAAGPPPDGGEWRVRAGSAGPVLGLAGGAVATSSPAAFTFDAVGRFPHLLDPSTSPAQHPRGGGHRRRRQRRDRRRAVDRPRGVSRRSAVAPFSRCPQRCPARVAKRAGGDRPTGVGRDGRSAGPLALRWQQPRGRSGRPGGPASLGCSACARSEQDVQTSAQQDEALFREAELVVKG